ncbi:MAG TPA: DHA2 family efflux MFS transporter permease subunit [Anaeromyxobacteraceae bacterium]|nr:DHA2 family efflux MFS transporter permease subunit [Anaeromyxobacteraceae bacterium]
MAEASGGDWRPSHNPWLVALTVTLATFMEVMDTSIANVALPHIAGGLAASQDEATWVLTSYLVSNAVVLPVSAWLSGLLGRKRFYMICVTLFTVSSFLCGFAPSLPALIFLRVLQGVGGGGLAPSEQAILADTFPVEKRGMAFAMYGMAVVFAPVIGPTLGGYIVDNANWRWIFYINVPVGIVSLFLSAMMVEDPPWLQDERIRTRRIRPDWLGLGMVVVAFGSLQVVMDKGQENDWFSSPFIVVSTLTMITCMLGTVIWEWARPNPIVNVRLFRNQNFSVSVLLMFMLGAVLFGTTVLIPLFLQTLMGYTAERAGEVMSPGGLVTMGLMPLAGYLVARVPAKYLIAAGFAGVALALTHMSGIDLDIDARTAMFYRIFIAANLPFLFIPINTVSYIGVPREQSNQVSGLMNLARNIGGSVGIAFLSTSLARRSQTFQNQLVGHVTQSNPFFHERMAELQRTYASIGPAQAMRRAYLSLYGTVQQQAMLLSYVHVIKALVIVSALLVPLILLLLKKNQPGGAPAGAH